MFNLLSSFLTSNLFCLLSWFPRTFGLLFFTSMPLPPFFLPFCPFFCSFLSCLFFATYLDILSATLSVFHPGSSVAKHPHFHCQLPFLRRKSLATERGQMLGEQNLWLSQNWIVQCPIMLDTWPPSYWICHNICCVKTNSEQLLSKIYNYFFSFLYWTIVIFDCFCFEE